MNTMIEKLSELQVADIRCAILISMMAYDQFESDKLISDQLEPIMDKIAPITQLDHKEKIILRRVLITACQVLDRKKRCQSLADRLEKLTDEFFTN